MPDVATVLKECSVSYRSTGIEYQLIMSFENETEVEIGSYWSKSVLAFVSLLPHCVY